eukprot:1078719-Amorphochlora_amoeboformis.AAC.1
MRTQHVSNTNPRCPSPVPAYDRPSWTAGTLPRIFRQSRSAPNEDRKQRKDPRVNMNKWGGQRGRYGSYVIMWICIELDRKEEKERERGRRERTPKDPIPLEKEFRIYLFGVQR